MRQGSKQQFQDWLTEFPFSHRIDIEASPDHPLPFDELCQRFRKILFDVNKKHLKYRNFPKWKSDDKFWIFGFKEGDVKGISQHQQHYHLLLHSPSNHTVNEWSDLQFAWIKYPSLNPITGKRRKINLSHKDPLQIETIRSKIGSSIYNSKKYQDLNYDDHFVIGLWE